MMRSVSCLWNGLRLTGGYAYEEPGGFHDGPGGLEVELDWTFGVEDGEELAEALDGDWGDSGTDEEWVDASHNYNAGDPRWEDRLGPGWEERLRNHLTLRMVRKAKHYADLPAEAVEWIHRNWWEMAYDELVAAARVAMRARGDEDREVD